MMLAMQPLYPVQRIAAYAQYPYMDERQSSRYTGTSPANRFNFSLPDHVDSTIRTAAGSVSAWMTQSRQLRMTANSMRNTDTSAFASVTDGGAIAKQAKTLVEQANQLNNIFASASHYLNPSLKGSVDDALNDPLAERIGITRSADGEWMLDEAQLKGAVAERPDDTRRTISGSNGITSRIEQSLARFDHLPTDALISPSARGFQSFTAYQSSMQSYLQLQLNGLFVNAWM